MSRRRICKHCAFRFWPDYNGKLREAHAAGACCQFCYEKLKAKPPKRPGNVIATVTESECQFCKPYDNSVTVRLHKRDMCPACQEIAAAHIKAETDREFERKMVAWNITAAAAIRAGRDMAPLPDDTPATEIAARAKCGGEVPLRTGEGSRVYDLRSMRQIG